MGEFKMEKVETFFSEVDPDAAEHYDYLFRMGNYHYWRRICNNQIQVSEYSPNEDKTGVISDPRTGKDMILDTKVLKNNEPVEHKFLDDENRIFAIPVIIQKPGGNGHYKEKIPATPNEYYMAYSLAKVGDKLKGSYYAVGDSE